MGSDLIAENTLIYVVLAILGLLMLWIVIAIARQPVQPADLPFKVPLVPIIPCLSILINLYLMLQLDSFTWMRFAVWMTIGMKIFEGIKKSRENQYISFHTLCVFQVSRFTSAMEFPTVCRAIRIKLHPRNL